MDSEFYLETLALFNNKAIRHLLLTGFYEELTEKDLYVK